MGQFAYGFTLTLLHSLWQSALLLLIYLLVKVIIRNQLPSVRRNFLYLLLVSQIIMSCITFMIYYSGSESLYEPLLALDFAAAFTRQPLFEIVAPWLLTAYMAAVMIKSFSLIYHWNKFKSNCSNTWLKPTVDLRLFTMVKAQEFGIRRKVSLWFSEAITTPVTYGFFRPVILLPVALVNQLTMEEAETLLVHELTHIRNHDYLLNFILIAADTLFFFNPFIKIIGGYIKLEREKNCDVQVLHFKYSSLVYAETLLKAARFKPVSRAFQLAAVSKNRQLLNRILFFTSEKNLQFNRQKHNAFSYLVLLIVLCVNMITLAELKRKHTADNSYAYSPVLVPGYSPDKAYSFFTDNAVKTAAGVAENIVTAVNNKTLLPEKELKKMIPSDKELSRISDEALEGIKLQEMNYAIPAAAVTPPETKEFVICEEDPVSGKSVTQAFKMMNINGQWIAQPLWMLTETRLRLDSIQSLKDSVIRPFNIVQ